MNSPTNQQPLQPLEIATGLTALVSSDGGFWLDLEVYQRWVRAAADVLAASAEGPLLATAPQLVFVAETSPRALCCPQCGALMQKYRLASHHPARVDRCVPCNGVWMDAAEWAALQQDGCTYRLLQIIGDAGQREIREAEARQRQQASYIERFGADDYARLQQTRDWLAAHPHRTELLAFLQKPAD
ncbi:hypothetical protein IGB42_01557 [Andreprevotia sp. IGB-42]|uniref:TFIIB-type zinc ribbon-containing protein n=1 Tax=Andreprevotia sp. IGB-42 TaxID=2497473 RepID=UPI00135C6574|nr:zf-TFIIB domain-containing protein [Andreprevotia sp. IGB-42]KAF0813878.1 hypothetical protein IGB42_01557 [Andreprevotia sp. IGB-42]